MTHGIFKPLLEIVNKKRISISSCFNTAETLSHFSLKFITSSSSDWTELSNSLFHHQHCLNILFNMILQLLMIDVKLFLVILLSSLTIMIYIINLHNRNTPWKSITFLQNITLHIQTSLQITSEWQGLTPFAKNPTRS